MESREIRIASLIGNRTVSHSLFWLVILLSYPVASLGLEQSFRGALIIKLFYLPTQMIAAYLLVYYQLPKLLYRAKIGQFAISILLSMYVLSTLTHGIIDHILIPNYAQGAERTSWRKIFFEFNQGHAFFVIWVYWVPVVMASVKLIKQSLERREAMQQLEKEKIQAELDTLQAQLHPRFLSNTLKTLHRLSLAQAEEAPELIANLSDMLDYMLYQAQATRVPLAQEIEVLQTFFELESLRHNGAMRFKLNWPENQSGIQIAPLLLFSLVENALVQEEGPAQQAFEVNCNVAFSDGYLSVVILNPQHRPSAPENKDTLRQQLNGWYPNQHELRWEISNHCLKASLKLKL